jgi:hypothetical protein
MKRIGIEVGEWVSRAKAALACAAVFVAAAAAGGCDPADADGAGVVPEVAAAVPADFVQHAARGENVHLKAPPAWVETPTSGTVVLNLRTGQPGSSVNLVVVPAAAGETLDVAMAKMPAQLAHEFADFRLEKQDFVIVNDLPAGRLVYEASGHGFRGKLMQLFIKRNNRNLILTYTAAPDRFDEEYPTVEQVVASLQVP